MNWGGDERSRSRSAAKASSIIPASPSLTEFYAQRDFRLQGKSQGSLAKKLLHCAIIFLQTNRHAHKNHLVQLTAVSAPARFEKALCYFSETRTADVPVQSQSLIGAAT
jgi:hypothetical protein